MRLLKATLLFVKLDNKETFLHSVWVKWVHGVGLVEKAAAQFVCQNEG